jgi:hypothetical protein
MGNNTMRKRHTLPDQEALLERFDYNPETGAILWRVRPRWHFSTIKHGEAWNAKFSGTNAGTLLNTGYVSVGIERKLIQAHRVIYKMMTGEEPPAHLDHVNRDRVDNRWCNIRPATEIANHHNVSIRKDNTTGFKGVSYKPKLGKFLARIQANGRRIEIGYFLTAQEAHFAYCAAAKQLFGEFWHGG